MSTITNGEDWVSLSEAAERYRVNRNTLAGWASGRVKRGRLRSKRVAGPRNLVSTLISVADLEKIVAAGVRPGPISGGRGR